VCVAWQGLQEEMIFYNRSRANNHISEEVCDLAHAPCRQQSSNMVDVLYYANEKLTGTVQRLLLDGIVAMIRISCVCENPTNASLHVHAATLFVLGCY